MDFIDQFEVCQMLHISDRTLSRLRSKGIIETYRFEGSRKNYYSKSQIQSMLKAQHLVNKINNRSNL